MKPKRLWIILAVIVAVIIADQILISIGKQEFDSKKWAQVSPFPPANQENDDDRGQMIDDLLDNHIRLGMHRDALQALVGLSDFSPSKSEAIVDEYWLNTRNPRWYLPRSLRMRGMDYLFLHYDSDSKLIRTNVREID